jgi:integrase
MSLGRRSRRTAASAPFRRENLEHAQKLLGHATRDMTEHYTRKRLGEKVSPVRRKL